MGAEFVTFLAILAAVSFVHSAEFSYSGDHGPDNWYKDAASCAGKKQSPIDIKTSSATLKNLGPFEFKGYDQQVGSGTGDKLTNNGHTISVSVGSVTATVKGAGLPAGEYKLAQFHLHWGSNDCRGSEHTLNGESYPGELHLVHYNTKYPNVSASLPHSDGLAVIGVFLDIGKDNNAAFQQIIDSVNKVQYKDENGVTFTPLKLEDLLPATRTDFVRYDGSLTTPPCSEAVTWTVLKQALKISQIQMNTLRIISSQAKGTTQGVALVDNYRPVMPLNSRPVYKTYDKPGMPVAKTTCAGCAMVATQGLMFFLFVLTKIYFRVNF